MFTSASRLLPASHIKAANDPNFVDVASLLHFNGTNGATTTTDVKGHTVTVGSGASLSTAQALSGTSSISVDGTANGYCSFSYPPFGIGDFTLEFAVFFTSISGAAAGNALLDGRPTSTDGVYPMVFLGSSGWTYYVNGASQISGGSATTGQWYRVAVCRSSGQTRLFVNGTQVGSTWSDTTSYQGGQLFMGKNQISVANLVGYIDELRVTPGVARYTANYTPSTTQFPDSGPAAASDPLFSSVYALLHFDGTNGATTTTDVKGHTVTVGSGCSIDTSQWLQGGSSMRFTKTAAANVALALPAFGTGDFTIEFWIRFNTVVASGGSDSMFDTRPIGANGPYIDILSLPGGGNWTYYVSSTTAIAGGPAPATGQWYHVALCRASGSSRLFLNGVQVGSTYADSTNFGANTVHLGANQNTGNGNLDGWIDELRVTTAARYTANFTPPSHQFANS